jgi:hypothetical protein
VTDLFGLNVPAPYLAKGWPMLPGVRGSAHFPTPGTRTELWREWGPEAPDKAYACFIGMNPSVARGDLDDKTIRTDMGFTQRLGLEQYCKVNLFALCATKPGDLLDPANAKDVFHNPGNLITVRVLAKEAKIVICCWGSLPKGPLLNRAYTMVSKLQRSGVDLHCYGVTKDGSPRHTSRLGYNAVLSKWPGYP